MSEIERFTDREGFIDGTAYLEYDHDDESMWLVMKSGERKSCNAHSLETCRRYVREGVWRVMEAEEAK
jgi:hypothetical protein